LRARSQHESGGCPFQLGEHQQAKSFQRIYHHHLMDHQLSQLLLHNLKEHQTRHKQLVSHPMELLLPNQKLSEIPIDLKLHLQEMKLLHF